MTWLWPGGCEGAGHKSLTSFSIDGEYTSNTSTEAPESLCKGLCGGSNGRSPETSQGILVPRI
jgi:hypothetical protein